LVVAQVAGGQAAEGLEGVGRGQHGGGGAGADEGPVVEQGLGGGRGQASHGRQIADLSAEPKSRALRRASRRRPTAPRRVSSAAFPGNAGRRTPPPPPAG